MYTEISSTFIAPFDRCATLTCINDMHSTLPLPHNAHSIHISPKNWNKCKKSSLFLLFVQCKSHQFFSLLPTIYSVVFEPNFKCFALRLMQTSIWLVGSTQQFSSLLYANVVRRHCRHHSTLSCEMFKCWTLTLTQLILYTKLSARAVEYSWVAQALVISLQNGSFLWFRRV